MSNTDLSLNACAPAINTGSNEAYIAAGGPTTDLAGNPRFYNGSVIDRGAYEYQGTPTTITLTAPSLSTTAQGVSFTQSFTATSGSSPYSFSLSSGSLPPGLRLSDKGVLSGRPTQAGVFPLGVVASDANGCSGGGTSYTLTVVGVCDLTASLFARPSTLYGRSTLTVVVVVSEVNGVASQGPVTVRINKDAKLTLRFSASATLVGGHSVQNRVWQFDASSEAHYYVLTTTESVGESELGVGLTGELSPGATSGVLGLGAIVSGEGEANRSNNTDADKIEYFPQ